MLQPAGADPVGALFIFLHLLERQAERIPSFSWLILSIIRRIRTRAPTCLSVGFGDLRPSGIRHLLRNLRECETSPKALLGLRHRPRMLQDVAVPGCFRLQELAAFLRTHVYDNLSDKSFSWTVKTFYGIQPSHHCLERSTWHMAQHIRQLQVVLDGYRVPLARRINEAKYKGLPMPEGLWE